MNDDDKPGIAYRDLVMCAVDQILTDWPTASLDDVVAAALQCRREPGRATSVPAVIEEISRRIGLPPPPAKAPRPARRQGSGPRPLHRSFPSRT